MTGKGWLGLGIRSQYTECIVTRRSRRHGLCIAIELWFMYGNHASTLRNLALKVLSQIVSSLVCERNWSTFALIHTKTKKSAYLS